jgi:hypothetical protein
METNVRRNASKRKKPDDAEEVEVKQASDLSECPHDVQFAGEIVVSQLENKTITSDLNSLTN